MANERVLLVDDDPAVLALCRRILEAEGYQVVHTNRGEDALDKVETSNYDLLLTDIRLPGLTGLDIAGKLRARGHDLTVVTMTGYSSMEMAIQALSLGVDEFIVKPFTPDSLRHTIARALEKSRLRRENTRLRALLPLFENARAFAGIAAPEELNARIVAAAVKTLAVQDLAHPALHRGAVRADAVGLAVADPAAQELKLVAACGAALESRVGATAALESPSVARILSLDGAQIWQGAEGAAQLPFELGLTAGQCACAPLRMGERGLGLLLAIRESQAGGFAAGDAEALAIVAGQAAAALENARLLEAINRAYRELQELDRVKSEFINIAAHELRTPLSVLLGYALLLRPEVEGDAREWIETMISNAERLRRIVDDMLSLRYLERGQAELRWEQFAVGEIVRAVAEAYRSLAEAKAQWLQTEVADRFGMLTADRAMVETMLGNLISNAVKFSPRGSEIHIKAKGDESEVTFGVIDRGIGIAPAQHEKIFERFYQVEPSLTRQYSGLGLGLAITRGMVQAHQGKIWVASELGNGSAFYITLPRRPDMHVKVDADKGREVL